MAQVLDFPRGGYRFIKGVFQYSAGVRAAPGFEIVRARLAKPLPLRAGFAAIERHLEAIGRPATSLCACELRSPKPFDEAGFLSFNTSYVVQLERWGIIVEGLNPVARSNVCPELQPPSEPALYAFSYTAAGNAAMPSFVIAGSGEAQEGSKTYAERTIRIGDRSPDGILEKARWVVGEMERRMSALGVGWADATTTQVYTVHDFHHLFGAEIVARGAARAGLTWHFCRPPIDVLDYEMDVRGLRTEIVLP